MNDIILICIIGAIMVFGIIDIMAVIGAKKLSNERDKNSPNNEKK